MTAAGAARRGWRLLVAGGSLGATAATGHAIVNAALLRRPAAIPAPLSEPVAVLLPVRDEAARVVECLRAVLGQTAGDLMQVLVLDDGSTDGTAEVVRQVAGTDRRVRVLTGRPLPPGWLGKPYACQQLADAADPAASVLVFLDADVVLAPHAVAATVDLLRCSGLDLLSPYPRQVAQGPAERLVQPLLQWSWLTFLPLRLAERSPRRSLAAANGQLLAVRRSAYQRCGGHAGISADVLDDVALLRAVKRTGGRGGVVDGTPLATCRMYDGWEQLSAGYTKSLWAAFGSPLRAVGVLGVLGVLFVVPAAAAIGGSVLGLTGYAAGVAGRVVAARRTGGRAVPDAFAHPASIAALGWLTLLSWRRRRAGALCWKGRPLGGPP